MRKALEEGGVYGNAFDGYILEAIRNAVESGKVSGESYFIVDPFGGAMTTALAAHNNKRRFITTEIMGEYILGGALRFKDAALMNPDVAMEVMHG